MSSDAAGNAFSLTGGGAARSSGHVSRSVDAFVLKADRSHHTVDVGILVQPGAWVEGKVGYPSVHWTLEPADARELADALARAADEAERANHI